MNLIKYKGYVANLNTLEIAGLPQEMEKVGDGLILPDFSQRIVIKLNCRKRTF